MSISALGRCHPFRWSRQSAEGLRPFKFAYGVWSSSVLFFHGLLTCIGQGAVAGFGASRLAQASGCSGWQSDIAQLLD